jgi:ABC-type lipoprotein export system ATPase subunit
MAIFQALNKAGRTIVLVTHDAEIAAHCQRVVRIEQGRIVADDRLVHPKQASPESVAAAEPMAVGVAEGARA